MTDEKPPYRVPSMAEVGELRGTAGLRAASTFSGCGATCLGFEMAGFEFVAASEFVEVARDTYVANHPGVPIDDRDVRELSVDEFLTLAGVEVGELDLLEGSPPCAGFSTAGKRHKGWGKVTPYSNTRQRSDDLFFEFVRLLAGVRPRCFVAENVSGLVKGVSKGYFKEILAALGAVGYRVEARMLDAQWLGVPQQRQRLIFVGVREDLGRDPAFPRPLRYRYSIAEAVPWLLDEVTEDEETGYPLYLNHSGQSLMEAWVELREGESSDRYFSLVRPDRNRPCPTLTASNNRRAVAGVTHPVYPRKLSLREMRRLAAFPDDFTLVGSYMQRAERIGRAVPPLMARAVAEVIRDEVLCAP